MDADKILLALKKEVEDGKIIVKERWLGAAFALNSLLYDENIKLYTMQQAVAKKKLEILKGQEKKNVAAVELEVDATDERREAKIQEAKILQILEFIRIAKKQSDLL